VEPIRALLATAAQQQPARTADRNGARAEEGAAANGGAGEGKPATTPA
jgi:hypothetical protein